MIRFASILAVFLAGCVQSPPAGGGGGGGPAPRPVTLTGNYGLVALNGQPVRPGITLEIAGDNSFAGQAPCNRYFGTLQAGSDFTFASSPIGATRRACPDLQLEGAYFQAFEAATQYRPGREGDTLALLDASGRTVASYVRARPQSAAIDLSGSWTVAAARVNGVLTGNPGPASTGITFLPGGEFSANLGCNTARGPVTQNGNALDFGAIAVTARQCFAPAPLEGPILAAFDLVRDIVPTPQGVDLVDAGGQPLLRLVR